MLIPERCYIYSISLIAKNNIHLNYNIFLIILPLINQNFGILEIVKQSQQLNVKS